MEYVYFIQCGDDGPVKIGFSKDPKYRLKIAQVYNPIMLRLIAFEPGSRKREAYYHKTFKDSHVYGEWFLPTPELMNAVDTAGRINVVCEDFRLSTPRGEACHNWKGDNASKASKRQRSRRKYKLKDKCERCRRKAKDVFHMNGCLDDNSHDNLQSLCRRCRMELDGTLDVIKNWNIINPRSKQPDPCVNCGKEEKYLTKKRCHTCYCYFLKKGVDRVV